MTYWVVLVAALLIGGVFMWSMLTAARDAARQNEEHENWAQRDKRKYVPSDWADAPGPWIGPKGEEQ